LSILGGKPPILDPADLTERGAQGRIFRCFPAELIDPESTDLKDE
jgi:hypothetical protein